MARKSVDLSLVNSSTGELIGRATALVPNREDDLVAAVPGLVTRIVSYLSKR